MSRGNDRRGMGRGRRLLVLGATPYQIPFIEYARAQGCHVITVDWDLRNPAHAHADESHEVSTTDSDAVLALARRIGIDAITTFGSDPAVPTVARVAAALGLPGADVDAVETLSRKDRFRAAQRAAGLHTPEFAVFGEGAADARVAAEAGAGAASKSASAAALPAHPRVVYKPVDNCSSKGVTVVEGEAEGDAEAPAGALGHAPLHAAARRHALEHSRVGLGIVEQYIYGVQLHGDGWLQEGRLIHHYIGQQRFSDIDGTRVPIGTCWPARPTGDPQEDAELVRTLVGQVETMARATGYLDGPVNIEARADAAGVVLIELAPRNGGGFIPDLQQHLTGFDFVGNTLCAALGQTAPSPSAADRAAGTEFRIGSHVLIHSRTAGRLVRLSITDDLAPFLYQWHDMTPSDGWVRRYVRSDQRLGVLLLEFPDLETQRRVIDHPKQWLTLEIAVQGQRGVLGVTPEGA